MRGLPKIRRFLLATAAAGLVFAGHLSQRLASDTVADYRALLSSNASLESEREFTRKLLKQYQREAARLMKGAAKSLQAGGRRQAANLLQSAAKEVLKLSVEGDPSLTALREEAIKRGRNYPRDQNSSETYLIIPPAQRTKFKQLAHEIQDLGTRVRAGSLALPLGSFLNRLWELSTELQDIPKQQLKFYGNYVADRPAEEAAGGHASITGRGPSQLNSSDDVQEIPEEELRSLNFEEVPVLSQRTFCGGRTKDHILESGGAGVALVDYDNDGLLDIFLVNAYELSQSREKIPHGNLLYRNLGNWDFENVSRNSGIDLASWGYGVCAGDYNDDGYIDLYVTNFGPNFLFRNNGNGTFTEVAAKAGVNHASWSTGCTFFDADQDGDLDLYVAGYADCTWEDLFRADRTLIWRGGPKVMFGPVGLRAARDVFYRNEGNGRFTESTSSSGFVPEKEGYGFGVLATDYDNDELVDLYVANDSNPNLLFHNLGKGKFEEVGLRSGVALSIDGRAQAGMGVDSADVDGDGLLDLIVTNFAHDTDTLYRNLGAGLFEDATQAWGLSPRTFTRLGWGVAFFDADLDGAVDLFIANGHLYPQVDAFPDLQESFRQKNQLLLNRKVGFRDVSSRAGPGLEVQKSSRGLAVGDLDNDGRLDLVISNIDDVPTVLRNRCGGSNHWMLLNLRKDKGKNVFCIGAKVIIDAGKQRQIREIRSGGGYLSQSDLRPHFGLGSYHGKVDVEVQIPGAGKWAWKQLPIDRLTSLILP
jgi:enediyne biosynthesis protein E4